MKINIILAKLERAMAKLDLKICWCKFDGPQDDTGSSERWRVLLVGENKNDERFFFPSLFVEPYVRSQDLTAKLFTVMKTYNVWKKFPIEPQKVGECFRCIDLPSTDKLTISQFSRGTPVSNDAAEQRVCTSPVHQCVQSCTGRTSRLIPIFSFNFSIR